MYNTRSELARIPHAQSPSVFTLKLQIVRTEIDVIHGNTNK